MATVGERLKEERLLRGWSQRDLAREAGTTAETVSSIETGQHEPRPSTLRKLAEGLGIEVRDFFREPAVPLGDTPREAGRQDLEKWLEEHGAKRLLLTDEEIIRNFERLATGSDREAIVDRFEQEARETLREETEVLDDLQLEWARGGALIPKASEALDPTQDKVEQLLKRGGIRGKERQRLGQQIRFRYRRYLRALDDFQVALFLEGRVDDFVMVVSNREIAEARKAALRQLREQAFEGERGA